MTRQLNNELNLTVKLNQVVILCRFITTNGLFHIVTLFPHYQSNKKILIIATSSLDNTTLKAWSLIMAGVMVDTNKYRSPPDTGREKNNSWCLSYNEHAIFFLIFSLPTVFSVHSDEVLWKIVTIVGKTMIFIIVSTFGQILWYSMFYSWLHFYYSAIPSVFSALEKSQGRERDSASLQRTLTMTREESVIAIVYIQSTGTSDLFSFCCVRLQYGK